MQLIKMQQQKEGAGVGAGTSQPPAPARQLSGSPATWGPGSLATGGPLRLPQLTRKVSLENQLMCLDQEQAPYFSGRNPATSHCLFFGQVKTVVEFLLDGSVWYSQRGEKHKRDAVCVWMCARAHMCARMPSSDSRKREKTELLASGPLYRRWLHVIRSWS